MAGRALDLAEVGLVLFAGLGILYGGFGDLGCNVRRDFKPLSP